MKKNKLHKIDLIFIIGIIVIGILGGVIDGFWWMDIEYGGFPLFSCISIFVSYAFWIGMLIYSFITYQDELERPRYVKWYIYFILPFVHIIFVIVGFVFSGFLIKIFNL